MTDFNDLKDQEKYILKLMRSKKEFRKLFGDGFSNPDGLCGSLLKVVRDRMRELQGKS
jgi:hypothetical protein